MDEETQKMLDKYGTFTGYLYLQVMDANLFPSDIEDAKKELTRLRKEEPEKISNLLKVIAGSLEEEPDMLALASEGLSAIQEDLYPSSMWDMQIDPEPTEPDSLESFFIQS